MSDRRRGRRRGAGGEREQSNQRNPPAARSTARLCNAKYPPGLSRRLGEACSGSFAPCVLVMHPLKEGGGIEWPRRPALLTLDQDLAQLSELCFLLFQQTKPGLHHGARGAVMTLGHLGFNEAQLMIRNPGRRGVCHEGILARFAVR